MSIAIVRGKRGMMMSSVGETVWLSGRKRIRCQRCLQTGVIANTRLLLPVAALRCSLVVPGMTSHPGSDAVSSN